MNFHVIRKTIFETLLLVFVKEIKTKLDLLYEVVKYPELKNLLPFSGNCLSSTLEQIP